MLEFEMQRLYIVFVKFYFSKAKQNAPQTEYICSLILKNG